MLGNKGSRKFYRVGGTRGGQDQFSWESVKTDKDRENYLGRWQKGKDILWYTRDNKKRSAAEIFADEKAMLQNKDNDLINEALGLAPKQSKFVETKLDQIEMKQLFSRGATERASVDIERIEGLGAAPSKVHDHIERLSTVEKEILRLKESSVRPVCKEDGGDGVDSKSARASSRATEEARAEEDEGRKHKKEKKEKKHKKEHKHHKEKHREKGRKRSRSRSAES